MATISTKNMTGEQLMDHYLDLGGKYSQTIEMAMLLLKPKKLYSLLEEAERTNQRLQVRRSNPDLITEPDIVELVPIG
ncbi:hypothetical protein GCM10027592_29350 [Spirosoma flavus]